MCLCPKKADALGGRYGVGAGDARGYGGLRERGSSVEAQRPQEVPQGGAIVARRSVAFLFLVLSLASRRYGGLRWTVAIFRDIVYKYG